MEIQEDWAMLHDPVRSQWFAACGWGASADADCATVFRNPRTRTELDNGSFSICPHHNLIAVINIRQKNVWRLEILMSATSFFGGLLGLEAQPHI